MADRRHVTLKGQGRDPNIFKVHYFENGSRQRLGLNGAPSPSQPYIKAVKNSLGRYMHSLSAFQLIVMLSTVQDPQTAVSLGLCMEDLILSLADNHFFYNDLEVNKWHCTLQLHISHTVHTTVRVENCHKFDNVHIIAFTKL